MYFGRKNSDFATKTMLIEYFAQKFKVPFKNLKCQMKSKVPDDASLMKMSNLFKRTSFSRQLFKIE